MVQPLGKPVWRFFKILKLELPYDLTTSLWGINPKEMKQDLEKISALPMFIAVSVIQVEMRILKFSYMETIYLLTNG